MSRGRWALPLPLHRAAVWGTASLGSMNLLLSWPTKNQNKRKSTVLDGYHRQWMSFNMQISSPNALSIWVQIPVSHPLTSCSLKMDQIASLWFLSKTHLHPDFSLQSTKFLCKIHEVANTPLPTSIRQLSETGKFCREQVIASSSNSSSTNTAELKSQQWKKWKQRSFWINMTVTHNLFWLTKPVVSTLG